jgi:hypothetical protein
MKKTLLVLLAVVVAVGALIGAGFAGFHIGYARGTMRPEGKADTFFGHYDRFFDNNRPGQGFQQNDLGFHRGFGPGGFHSRGFGFMFPSFALLKVAVLGLIAWGAYKLFTGNGWQLTLTRHPVESAPVQSAESPAPKKSGRSKK